MLQISPDALRDGCERAHDLFRLNRLRGRALAAQSFEAVFDALGVDAPMRERLHDEIVELLPVRGDPMIEAGTAVSILAGVLVGLLIADSALPGEELDLPVVSG